MALIRPQYADELKSASLTSKQPDVSTLTIDIEEQMEDGEIYEPKKERKITFKVPSTEGHAVDNTSSKNYKEDSISEENRNEDSTPRKSRFEDCAYSKIGARYSTPSTNSDNDYIPRRNRSESNAAIRNHAGEITPRETSPRGLGRGRKPRSLFQGLGSGRNSWSPSLPKPEYVIDSCSVKKLKEKVMDSHCHLDFIQNRLSSGRQMVPWSRFKLDIDPCDKLFGLVTNFCDPVLWDTGTNLMPGLMAHIQYVPGIYYTVGCHPHHAEKVSADWLQNMERMFEIDRLNKCVAVGECGLDKGPNNNVPLDIQKEVFRKQLELALKLNVPLVLHVRDTEADARAIIKEVGVPPSHSVHRHCFTGSWEECEAWIAMFPKAVFGFTNVITYQNRLNEVIRNLNMDQIVLETDAPYFVPSAVDISGKRLSDRNIFPRTLTTTSGKEISQPMHVLHVAAKVAQIKNLTIDQVLKANTRNIHRVYRIPMYL